MRATVEKIYCNYALIRPEELEIVGVVDTNTFRLNEVADRYGVPVERCFTELDEFLKSGIECDFVVNATMDEIVGYIEENKYVVVCSIRTKFGTRMK